MSPGLWRARNTMREELYRFRFNHKNVLEIQYFHRELENDEMIPVIDSTEELVYGV